MKHYFIFHNILKANTEVSWKPGWQMFWRGYGKQLFIHNGVVIHYTSVYDPKRQIFKKFFFMAGLFTLRVFATNLLSGNSRRKNFFFIFSFWCLTWYTNLGFTSNKPTYYLLDYGGFVIWLIRNWLPLWKM